MNLFFQQGYNNLFQTKTNLYVRVGCTFSMLSFSLSLSFSVPLLSQGIYLLRDIFSQNFGSVGKR